MAMEFSRGRGKNPFLRPPPPSVDDDDDELVLDIAEPVALKLNAARVKKEVEEEEVEAFNKWLSRPADGEIPTFCLEAITKANRKPRLLGPEDSVLGILPVGGRGRGRGIPMQNGYCKETARMPGHSSGGAQALPPAQSSKNNIFGKYVPTVPTAATAADPVSNKNIVNNQRFQKSLVKYQLESSWDMALTDRNDKVPMSDPEFHSTIKTSGQGPKECEHVVIHTKCACTSDRVFGVCARCYLIFCDNTCLQSGISNGQGRIGCASKSLFEGEFGIADNTSIQKGAGGKKTGTDTPNTDSSITLADNRSHVTESAPATAVLNETHPVRVNIEKSEIEDASPIEVQTSAAHRENDLADNNTNMTNTCAVRPNAAIERHLPKRMRIKVKLCPRPASYAQFAVIKDSDKGDYGKITRIMTVLPTFGIPMLQRDTIRNYRNESGNLCCVRHPVTLKFVRGRIMDIDENEKVQITLIDTGEIHYFGMNDLLELPGAAMDIPPLAYQCSLPIVYSGGGPDEANNIIMERFYRLNQFHVDASVLEIDNGIHIIDLLIISEKISFCEAALTANKARFKCTDELQARLTKLFSGAKGSLVLPTVDKRARDLTALSHRLNELGLEHENFHSNSGIDSTVALALTSIEQAAVKEDFKHSYNGLRPLMPICELEGKSCKFNRCIGMNSFSIMSIEAEYSGRLERSIQSWIRSGISEYASQETLRKNQVVLCPVGNTYARGVIISFCGSLVRVRLLEYGTQSWYGFKDLRRPSDEIFEVPLFVYFVKLMYVNDDIPILVEQFQELRSRMGCIAKVTEVEFDPESKSMLPKVEMIDEKTGQSLAGLMNKLAVWKWRQLYRAMYITMEEIVAVETYGQEFQTRQDYFSNCLITNELRRAILDVRVQYSSAPIFGTSIVLFCLPHDPIINYHIRTLQSQMHQLFNASVLHECMSEEQFQSYPHMMCVRPSHDREKMERWSEKFFPLCTWHRVFYNPELENIICFDCFWRTSDFKELELRPLPIDFYAASPLGLMVEIPVTDMPLKRHDLRKIAKKHFPRGATRTITMASRQPKMEIGMPLYRAISSRPLEPTNNTY